MNFCDEKEKLPILVIYDEQFLVHMDNMLKRNIKCKNTFSSIFFITNFKRYVLKKKEKKTLRDTGEVNETLLRQYLCWDTFKSILTCVKHMYEIFASSTLGTLGLSVSKLHLCMLVFKNIVCSPLEE